jgi:hypothetical protein
VILWWDVIRIRIAMWQWRRVRGRHEGR